MGAFTMRCFLNLLLPVIVTAACLPMLAQTPDMKLGTTPTAEEIRKWDIAVGPEGKELPPGSGTAKDGEKVFGQRCAVCHGPTAEGTEMAPRLVGGIGTLNTPRPVKTVGSYWPFATTVWDYINRAMPLNNEGSLSPDEVYAVTAFLLYRNGIIKENDVIDSKSLPKVPMPNRNGFIPSEPMSVWKPGMRRPFGYYPDH